MKCPNCGAEMKDGYLYCEHCGEEIHMVPDFEPEVELNIEETISGIAKDIEVEQATVTEVDVEDELGLEPKIHFTLKSTALIGIIVLVLVIIGGIVFFQYNQNHSLVYQTTMAKQCTENEKYDEALEFYERAMELSGDDISLKLDMAEIYFLKNDKTAYEMLLQEVVKDERTTYEQLESTYAKLIAIYRAREDFESINRMLAECGNENIMAAFQNYMATAPEFSVQEGFYTSTQALKLSALGNGKIYYTTDGTTPGQQDTVYTAPIILGEGVHVIMACYVNEYGVFSDVIQKNYTVEIELLSSPNVETVSGEYHFPTQITVDGDAENIYYTTDGTTPTIHSTAYTGPINMPLGKSTYKFIRIHEGRTSEVVERAFELELNAAYTVEEAEKEIVAYCLQSGKIKNELGVFDDTGDLLRYHFDFALHVDDTGDFYVISEIHKNMSNQILTKTGNYYALNIYSGVIYKLQIDEFNNYTLVEIEGQSYE